MLHQQIKFRNMLTALVLLPWIVPEVVTALAWRGIFDPVFGGLNGMLLAFGIIDKGIPWLGTPQLALPAVTAVNVWKGIPFFTITLLAGMKAIDAELYDAASVDGANSWRKFLHITLPGLRYVIIVCTLLSTIWTFNNFDDHLPADRRRAGRRDPRLHDPGLRGDRRAALQPGDLDRAGDGAGAGVIIFVLGRYMMNSNQRVDDTTSAGARGAAAITWPFRIVFRALVWAFFLVNDAVESVLFAIGRTVRGSSGGSLVSYRASKRIGRTVLYVCLGALLFFELFPFYWVIITAFKQPDQVRAFRSVFWPDPFTLQNFQLHADRAADAALDVQHVPGRDRRVRRSRS